MQENRFMQQLEMFPTPAGRSSVPVEVPHPIELLRGEHERQRRFCRQLGTLADDIWQLGHERLALSLLEFATVDIANNMEDQCKLLAPALLRSCVAEAGPTEVVTEMVGRHHGVASLVTSTIDGLDRIASGGVPAVPIHFILSALQLVEVLGRDLDWQEEVLLPVVASRLTEADQRDLRSAMARRRLRDPFGMD